MTQGLISGPMLFKVVFKPRSKQAKKVVRREWITAEKDVDVLLGGIKKA